MKRLSDIAISLVNVSKKYEIHHEKPTLVEKFVHGRNETFWALQNISLTIHKGERLGIIGPNGSGKTTLLKLITGITAPTSGTVETKGKVVSLIDLAAGFHPDLSGYQNIYLNAMLLKLTKKQIESVIHSIIQFADIRQFIDIPLYAYSSGMILRLGFSIAIHANPDILILDEMMSVGDAKFQQKATQKLEEFFRNKVTLVFVSHQLEYVQKYCNRVLILKSGSVQSDGSIRLIDQYRKS